MMHVRCLHLHVWIALEEPKESDLHLQIGS